MTYIPTIRIDDLIHAEDLYEILAEIVEARVRGHGLTDAINRAADIVNEYEDALAKDRADQEGSW